MSRAPRCPRLDWSSPSAKTTTTRCSTRATRSRPARLPLPTGPRCTSEAVCLFAFVLYHDIQPLTDATRALGFTATGVIVGPDESLRDIFPEGSDPAAWKEALDAVSPKNTVKDIEARCVVVCLRNSQYSQYLTYTACLANASYSLCADISTLRSLFSPFFLAHSIVQHVSSSLARAPYNLDTVGTYQATALSARDRLIKSEFVVSLNIQSIG